MLQLGYIEDIFGDYTDSNDKIPLNGPTFSALDMAQFRTK